jgi:hypothetical protein
MAQEASAADRQAEEVVQQILGFSQGNAEVGAAIGGQQTRPRPDMGAG